MIRDIQTIYIRECNFMPYIFRATIDHKNVFPTYRMCQDAFRSSKPLPNQKTIKHCDKSKIPDY